MRALLAAALIGCAGAGAAAPAAGPEDAVQASAAWRERVSFFRTFGQSATVVMLGDSLTDGAEWRELFPHVDIVNRGIDGDTTAGVLARLDDVLRAKPRQVFLMLGINDLADTRRSVDAVAGNYAEIVTRLQRGGARVFIQSTLPCHEAKGAWKSCKTLNAKVAQLDKRLAGMASANTTYIDLWPVLADAEGLAADFTYDGVHLNGDGYRRWRDAIAAFMP